ncbi:hypothetical protein Trydic_g10187, partial [Trypoxylus dichotomus]
MDDIIVFSTSLQEHVSSLRKVFTNLRNAGLKIQLDKSEFLCKSVEFLGHVVTPEGVKPNPKKIEAIKRFPIPKTAKEIKRRQPRQRPWQHELDHRRRIGPSRRNTTTTPFNDDVLARLKEAVANASEDSSASDMEFDDDIETDTTVTNTSADDFRPPSRRQQRKRKGSCNSGSDGESKKRPVANTNPEGTSAVPKKEGRIPP